MTTTTTLRPKTNSKTTKPQLLTYLRGAHDLIAERGSTLPTVLAGEGFDEQGLAKILSGKSKKDVVKLAFNAAFDWIESNPVAPAAPVNPDATEIDAERFASNAALLDGLGEDDGLGNERDAAWQAKVEAKKQRDEVAAFNAKFAKGKKAKGAGKPKAKLLIEEDTAAFVNTPETGMHQFTVHPDGSCTYGDVRYGSCRKAGIAAGVHRTNDAGKVLLNPWKVFKVTIDGVTKPLAALREGYTERKRKVKAKDPAKIREQIAKASERLKALQAALKEAEAEPKAE